MRNIRKNSKGSLILISFIIMSALTMACVQNQGVQKVPVIEVNFTHYLISGQHIVKINSLKKIEVEKDRVKITTSPPFPGIHVFAIYPLKGKVLISPVAFTSLDVEGETTVYIGIEKDKLPETGTNITVVIEVRDANGNRLAADKGVVKWV